MFIELIVAAISGVSQALAQRVISGRDTTTSLSEAMKEVKVVRELQEADRRSVAEVRKQLREAIKRADGLELRRNKVVFCPTEATLSPAEAFVNLDLEISAIKASLLPPISPTRAERSPVRDTNPDSAGSVLIGIEEEIAALRVEGSSVRR